MKLLLLVLCLPVLLIGQWPTSDAIEQMLTGRELERITEEIQMAKDIRHNTLSTDLWLGQIFLSKLPWATSLPQTAQNTQVVNTIGELAAWGPALASGYGGRLAWSQARYRLMNLGTLLSGKLPAGTTPPIVGSPFASQLATVEALDGAGENNLAIIGQARDYLTRNLPAVDGLQKQILSPEHDANGPTQQMQLVATSSAQQSSLAVQNLNVQTGLLETITGLAKHFSDQVTADLNLQEDRAKTMATNPTGPSGWAESFTNHK